MVAELLVKGRRNLMDRLPACHRIHVVPMQDVLGLDDQLGAQHAFNTRREPVRTRIDYILRDCARMPGDAKLSAGAHVDSLKPFAPPDSE